MTARKTVALKATYRDVEGKRYVAVEDVINILAQAVVEQSEGFDLDVKSILKFFLDLKNN